MKTSKETTDRQGSKSVVIGVLFFVIVIVAFLFWQRAFENYAETAAKPLEKSLVGMGARKVSSTGDSGRGVDNNSPWYESKFTIGVGEQEAIKLVEEAALQNGYTLVHATAQKRGPLGAVADKYIDSWYYDNISKDARFEGLTNGKVELSIGVNYNQETGAPDPSPTMIKINLRLPSYK